MLNDLGCNCINLPGRLAIKMSGIRPFNFVPVVTLTRDDETMVKPMPKIRRNYIPVPYYLFYQLIFISFLLCFTNFCWLIFIFNDFYLISTCLRLPCDIEVPLMPLKMWLDRGTCREWPTNNMYKKHLHINGIGEA
jgi:hypothetical protein